MSRFLDFKMNLLQKNLLNLTLKSDIFEYFRSKFCYFKGCPDFLSFQYGRYEYMSQGEGRTSDSIYIVQSVIYAILVIGI